MNILKPKTHANIQAALIHKTKWVVKAIGYVAVGFLLVHWFVGGQQEIVSGNDVRQAAPHSPVAELAKHRSTCWTSIDQPKAQLPGAAIVQYKDGYTEYVTSATPRGRKLVDAAFNEALSALGVGGTPSKEIDVVALCV